MRNIVLLLLLVITISRGEQDPLFPAYSNTSSLLHDAFNGGGVSLVEKGTGIGLNPASLLGYHKLFGKKSTISGAYHQGGGSFDVSGAFSIAFNRNRVFAIDYLYGNELDMECPSMNRGSIAYSALIREDPKEGFLAWGVNLSYYHTEGLVEAEPTYVTINGGQKTTITTDFDFVSGTDRMVATDIALYQFDKQYGLNYGVVFENILGYRWKTSENDLVFVHRDTILPDSTLLSIDTVRYSGESLDESDWLKGNVKSLMVGISLNRQIFGDKVYVQIPFDVRFWGFMDKHLRKNSAWRDRCMLYTGGELNFGGHFALRGGYSWAPREYFTDNRGNPQFSNRHQASGGFKVAVSVVDIEMAFKKNEIAGGVSLGF